MNKLPKSLVLAGVAVMLLGGVAFASVGNDHTGAESTNHSSVSVKNDGSIMNHNDADIWNNIKGWAKSGGNKADENTGDGSVTSGNASGTVKITNTANTNSSTLAAAQDMGSADVSNSVTGAESTNDAWVKVRNNMSIVNRNDADVHNNLCVTSNSGENKASENTGDGSVHAGGASLDMTITNTLNSNDVTVQ